MGRNWDTGSDVAGEYIVDRLLGSGGFGQVALVTNSRTGAQYAAKRVIRPDPLDRRRFIDEAQRWIALPDHPNVTPCRFVRSTGEELVIFSEYLPGGSLADAIRTRQLYAERDDPLRTILLAAVGMAYGIEAGHVAGMLHLDVKPSNLLFTEGRDPKVTDFGLAVAAHAGSRQPHGATLIALPPGATLAYASPEHATGGEVGRGADVWSWAASVLEAFLGYRPWAAGTVAGFVLERTRAGRYETRGAAMPHEVGTILTQCFLLDPRQRPKSLGDVADTLLEVVHGGSEAPPAKPTRPTPLTSGPLLRRSGDGVTWQPPALVAEAVAQSLCIKPPPAGVSHLLTGDRRAQLLADIAAYDDLRAAVEEQNGGNAVARHEVLALIHANVASVKNGLGDQPGALIDLELASRHLRHSDSDDARWYRPKLHLFTAETLSAVGRYQEALRACDESWRTASEGDDPKFVAADRGRALMTRVDVIRKRSSSAREGKSTLRLCDRAVTAFLQADDVMGAASALGYKAKLLAGLERPREAEDLWRQADELLAGLDDADPAVRAARAREAVNKAAEATSPDQRLRLARTAIDLFRPLVRDHGDFVFAARLGYALLLRARALVHFGHNDDAASVLAEARCELERAVLLEGHTPSVTWLAECYGAEAGLLRQTQGPAAAIELARRAVDLWGRVVAVGGPIYAVHLAHAHLRLAQALAETAEFPEALARFDDAENALAEVTHGSRASARRISAQVAIGRSRICYLQEDTDGARENLKRAVALLADATEPDDVWSRLQGRRLLAALVTPPALAAQHIEEALLDARPLVASGRLPEKDVTELHQKLAGYHLADGDLEHAEQHARFALERTERATDALSEEATADLIRAVAIIAIARARRGQLSEALAVLEHGDAARQELDSLVDELRKTLSEGSDALLARATETAASADALMAARRTRNVSHVLEDLHGRLLWLEHAQWSLPIARMRADIALRFAITATAEMRASAARRASAAAVDAYRTLVVERQQSELVSRWLEAQYWRVSTLTALGETIPAAETLDGLLASVLEHAPEQLKSWHERVRPFRAHV